MRKLSSISRRKFTQLIGVGAASVVAQPAVALSNQALSKSFVVRNSPAGTLVRLNSNENPYGPSPHALKAMTQAFELVWRYPDEHADTQDVDHAAELGHGR